MSFCRYMSKTLSGPSKYSINDRSNPALNVGFKPWAPVVIKLP